MNKVLILKENGEILICEFQENLQEEIERYLGSKDLVITDYELYSDVNLIYARENSNPSPFGNMLKAELYGDVILAHSDDGKYEGLNDWEISRYQSLDDYMVNDDIESSLYLVSDEGIAYYTFLEEAISDFKYCGFYKNKYKTIGIEYLDRNQETQIQDIVKQYKDKEEIEYISYSTGNYVLDELSSHIKDKLQSSEKSKKNKWKYEVVSENICESVIYSFASISPDGHRKELIRSNSSAILELFESALADADELFEKSNEMLGGLGDLQRIDFLSNIVAELEELLKGYSKIYLYFVNATSLDQSEPDKQKGIFVDNIIKQEIESFEFEDFVYAKLELATKKDRKHAVNKLLKTPEFVSAMVELKHEDTEEKRRKACEIVYDTMKDEFV